MHSIEPYYNWRHLYIAEEDEQSPFFGHQYSEFEFSNTIYNYYIHPQWDEIGSRTLYIKIIYADYDLNMAIIELIGEWNDVIENDIETLKRTIIEHLIAKKIYKFIFIGENILTFHGHGNDYYEEWYEEINSYGGWITFVNFLPQTIQDFKQEKIHHYIHFIEIENWRTIQPEHLFQTIDNTILNF
ncbi:MAG: hypothetical protein IT215_02860 [Chitinophagaceae bacterium]|nr:MAG: hypothetical protein UZ11_BCD004000604 [Bacteroidetes bacterium OLB11]MCC6447605.1 hypothetical protein [Chitinophagaceae bacterium]HMN32419.1 hypothetical protein [Chitinophagaceae bacterium]